ncbi:hypothetical protein V5O48_007036 [Marasmius crinis-equi]|uniref:HMG box domain-containing protein n=1 Tax=Marasmius crinis-equi TaxID=585013 RepID=A0ABR3FHX5_9AGAR
MLTTRSRIQGWQPFNLEGDEVVVPPSQPHQLYTFSINPNAQSPAHEQPPGAGPAIHIPNYDTPTTPTTLEDPPSPENGEIHYTPHVPRPRNCFMIFRCAYVASHKRRNGISPSSDMSLSKQASEAWSCLTPKEREKYELLAEQEKIRHAQNHPNYVYRPRKRDCPGISARSSGPGTLRGSRISKRGRYSQRGVKREDGGVPANTTRRRSCSMPLRTQSHAFLHPVSSSMQYMRRAMSVGSSRPGFEEASPVESSFVSPCNTSSRSDILLSEPCSPIMDDLSVCNDPPLSTDATLANWDGIATLSPQPDFSTHPVLPWPCQPSREPCSEEEWHEPSTLYTQHCEPQSSFHPRPEDPSSLRLYPWQHYPSTPYTPDTQWGNPSLVAEACSSYDLANFGHDIAQQALTHGGDPAFEISSAGEQEFFEGYLNF